MLKLALNIIIKYFIGILYFLYIILINFFFLTHYLIIYKLFLNIIMMTFDNKEINTLTKKKNIEISL